MTKDGIDANLFAQWSLLMMQELFFVRCFPPLQPLGGFLIDPKFWAVKCGSCTCLVTNPVKKCTKVWLSICGSDPPDAGHLGCMFLIPRVFMVSITSALMLGLNPVLTKFFTVLTIVVNVVAIFKILSFFSLYCKALSMFTSIHPKNQYWLYAKRVTGDVGNNVLSLWDFECSCRLTPILMSQSNIDLASNPRYLTNHKSLSFLYVE